MKLKRQLIAALRHSISNAPISGVKLALTGIVSLAVALSICSCAQVASSSSSSLIRAIDASYAAPAVSVSVEGLAIATNVGRGTITQYGAVSTSPGAAIAVTAGSAALAQTHTPLASGQQQTVLIADKTSAKNEYTVTVLEDQATAAPAGTSSFRFLNQAAKTGKVDVYMVPGSATLGKSTPLSAGLALGNSSGYLNFTAQTVTMVVTPAGSTKAKYTSQPIALTGGEVRTVLILDTALTSNPPVEVFVADDVN